MSSQPIAMGAIGFRHLADIAMGETARVDLCRADDGRLLAVKRLHAHLAGDAEFEAMFYDETWLTAALKHRNIVEVAGWGDDEQGRYLAVELVQGVSLARLLKTVVDTGEVFGERMVAFIAMEVCAGLGCAHGLRSPEGELLHLVHRDLTPGNVLVGFRGEVKIADYGIAKARRRATRTLSGIIKGPPAYMAPEQARGGEIDGRADIFSLGVMLYELLSGKLPWTADTAIERATMSTLKAPTDIFTYRPRLDRDLVAIVMKCMEKDPAARFPTAEALRGRLIEWLSVRGYEEDNDAALGRFVRRNAMRQMRWFERVIARHAEPVRPEAAASNPAWDEPSTVVQRPKSGALAPAGVGLSGLPRLDVAIIDDSDMRATSVRPQVNTAVLDARASGAWPATSGLFDESDDDAAITMPRGSAAPSMAGLQAEAARLGAGAEHYRLRAEAAAREAEHAAAVARLAARASDMADEAVSIAATQGLAAGALRLEAAQEVALSLVEPGGPSAAAPAAPVAIPSMAPPPLPGQATALVHSAPTLLSAGVNVPPSTRVAWMVAAGLLLVVLALLVFR